MTDSNIAAQSVPEHIAIIMDGNGRWAKNKGEDRIHGHRNGIDSVREVVEGCGELGVKYLTLYAFSTENWNRPKEEVEALMSLLVNTIKEEISKLKKNKVRLKVIGDIDSLPANCQSELEEGIHTTKDEDGLTLILALSYSSKWELQVAMKKIAEKVKSGMVQIEDIDDELIHQHLNTAAYPDPELLIRTGGERRISNFLLYQIAYTELYFSEVHWPDFRKTHLTEAIEDYQSRERRFGKTSEQIK
ncbi:MAG: isoprenyl transferase [Taibaiella sp.]|nr:isoprenyl transferase [Taibaiella sp.]